MIDEMVSGLRQKMKAFQQPAESAVFDGTKVVVLATGEVLIDPIVVHVSAETFVHQETDSEHYPGVVVEHKRARSIRLRHRTVGGDVVTTTFDGLAAGLIQQHLDRLAGRPLLFGVSGFRREKLLQQAKKAQRARRRIVALTRTPPIMYGRADSTGDSVQ